MKPGLFVIFADDVRFTEDRTIEAQVEIIAALNRSFEEAICDLETVYLPTGDGICAGILQVNVAADIHLQTALRELEIFYDWSSKAENDRHAEIRIAINESGPDQENEGPATWELCYKTPAAAAKQELPLRATPSAPVPAGDPSLNQ